MKILEHSKLKGTPELIEIYKQLGEIMTEVL